MIVRTTDLHDVEADGKRLNTSKEPSGEKSVYFLPGIKKIVFRLLNNGSCFLQNCLAVISG